MSMCRVKLYLGETWGLQPWRHTSNSSERLLQRGSESESEITQLCPTLCNHMNCNLPGSCIHGIFHTGGLEWVAISFFRGSSQPRDRTHVSHIAGRCFTVWATREPLVEVGEEAVGQYMILVKGEFSVIKPLLYKRFSAHQEKLMSPRRDLMII